MTERALGIASRLETLKTDSGLEASRYGVLWSRLLVETVETSINGNFSRDKV